MLQLDVSEIGVTVVIPNYNYAHYLPQTIESCLSQNHGPLEVLVVDDESKDDSVAVASAYGAPVRVLCQKNQGVGAARNYGMREATHDLVIFLDADDMLAPGAVQVLLEAFFAAPEEPGVLAGCALFLDVEGHSMGLPPHPVAFDGRRKVPLEEVLMFTPFVPTVLARRDFLLSLGGFETDDKTYRGSEDKALWIDVAASSRPVVLFGQVTVHYRVHQQSMSHNGLRQLASSQAVLKRAQSRYSGILPRSVWSRAWAFSFFQAAIIYGDAGQNKIAMVFLMKSIWLSPILRHPLISNRYGRWFRLFRLINLLGKYVRSYPVIARSDSTRDILP